MTRWSRWGCCARWTCSACCPNRCATASSTCSPGPKGTFSFYRGVVNRQESFPLGLDTFEMLGAGVVSLPADLLETRFAPLEDLRPVAVARRRFDPETFKIGPTPGAVLDMLDGRRTAGRLAGVVRRPRRARHVPTNALSADRDRSCSAGLRISRAPRDTHLPMPVSAAWISCLTAGSVSTSRRARSGRSASCGAPQAQRGRRVQAHLAVVAVQKRRQHLGQARAGLPAQRHRRPSQQDVVRRGRATGSS